VPPRLLEPVVPPVKPVLLPVKPVLLPVKPLPLLLPVKPLLLLLPLKPLPLLPMLLPLLEPIRCWADTDPTSASIAPVASIPASQVFRRRCMTMPSLAVVFRNRSGKRLQGLDRRRQLVLLHHADTGVPAQDGVIVLRGADGLGLFVPVQGLAEPVVGDGLATHRAAVELGGAAPLANDARVVTVLVLPIQLG